MKIYRYDGSYEGFLCAVVMCLECGVEHPEFMRDGDNHDTGLFAAETFQVATLRDVALTFRKRFILKVSQESFATARYAFHSQKDGIERLLWNYFKLGLEAGGRLSGMLAVEPVFTVNRIARQVSHEAHKFKGFVRFREVEAGFLYATIEPQADILPLIAPHFIERVGDRPWMIHDIQRSQAAVYDLKLWRLIKNIELNSKPGVTDAEQNFTSLWQRYFDCHAIAERHNPRLQQKHIPLRYRKHLTEFQSG